MGVRTLESASQQLPVSQKSRVYRHKYNETSQPPLPPLYLIRFPALVTLTAVMTEKNFKKEVCMHQYLSLFQLSLHN